MIEFIYTILLVFIFLFFLELLLRAYSKSYLVIAGLNIKKIPILSIEREYEFIDETKEKINWREDKKFGWVLKENSSLGIRIRIRNFNLNREFFYNTDERGRRITSNTNLAHIESIQSISIYGCSITYGHSLSDHQTYAWLLQNKFPNFKINNYGVAGYSLYQSLMAINNSITIDKQLITVIGFHEDLGWRNTCSFEWAERLQTTWKVPSAISKNYRLKTYEPKSYYKFTFGEEFRILTVLERIINKIKFRGRGNKIVIRQTMEHLLLSIRKKCEENGSKLLIACLDDCESYYEFFDENDFDWCVTEINTKELNSAGEYKWILFPFDNHPNEQANIKYSESIKDALNEMLIGKRAKPLKIKIKKQISLGDPGRLIYPHS